MRVRHPEATLEVTRSIDIAAPPAEVWTAIGDFAGIGVWHPAIEQAVLSTENGVLVRALALKGGGGVVVEKQISRDEAARSYVYAIVSGPLPVEDYSSTIAVEVQGDGSRVVWSGSFNAKHTDNATAIAVITSVYDTGLAGLAEGF